MNTRHIIRRWLVLALLTLAFVAGCGGGGDEGNTVALPAPSPAMPQTTPAVVVGIAGGIVNGPDGVTVTIPPEALAADTSLQITTAVPGELLPLPAGVQVGPKMYALLPHGVRFSVPVTLTLPRSAGEPADGVSILKTNADGTAWEQLVTSTSDTTHSALITSFSVTGVRCGPGPGGICGGSGGGGSAAAPPVISMHPVSGSVDEGGYVLLSVTAIGVQPLTYQWLRDGNEISRETTSAIVINPVSLAENGMRLSVRVTDRDNRSITSNDGVVTVRAAAPVIVNELRDQDVVAGTTALFTATTNSSVAQEFKWERLNLGAASWIPASSTTNQLTLPNVQIAADNQALFRMLARNVGGIVWTMTRPALLTVRPTETAPAIVRHPGDQMAFAGRGASFDVVATGGNLTYEWVRDRTPPPIRGATSAQLTISNTTVADDGAKFHVVVSNSKGFATSNQATLTVTPTPAEVIPRLGGGFEHSLALHADATLIAWGRNRDGELGRGMFSDMEAPERVVGLTGVATFASGWKHNLAVLSTATGSSVHAWGRGNLGQLGDGTTSTRSLAVQIGGFFSSAAVSFVTGSFGSIALDRMRQHWSWGTDLHGDGTSNQYLEPQLIGGGYAFRRAAQGDLHTLATGSNGFVHAWGNNIWGQLGSGDTTGQTEPKYIPQLAQVISVAAGTNHSLALTADGTVYAWGLNEAGQVGTGSTTLCRVGSTTLCESTPMAVALPGFVISIAAGEKHSMALLSDGRVYAWGENFDGQLGNGSPLLSRTPVRVNGSWTGRIVNIGAGRKHSLALDEAGNVWAWGANDRMQLGDGTVAPRSLPVQVQMQGRPLNLN